MGSRIVLPMALGSQRTGDDDAGAAQWWISLNVARTRVSLLAFDLKLLQPLTW